MQAAEHAQSVSPELARRAREWHHAPKPQCVWALGRNLHGWRKRNKMGYKRMAALLGCHAVTLSRLENHPLAACRLSFLDLLAERTGIPVGVWMTDASALPEVISGLLEIHGLSKVVQALGKAACKDENKAACAALPQAV